MDISRDKDIVADSSLQDTHSDKQEYNQQSGQWIGFQLSQKQKTPKKNMENDFQ